MKANRTITSHGETITVRILARERKWLEESLATLVGLSRSFETLSGEMTVDELVRRLTEEVLPLFEKGVYTNVVQRELFDGVHTPREKEDTEDEADELEDRPEAAGPAAAAK